MLTADKSNIEELPKNANGDFTWEINPYEAQSFDLDGHLALNKIRQVINFLILSCNQ